MASDLININSLDGYCPVQGEGTIAGKPFYFRARGSRWSIGIGDNPISNPEWSYGESYGNDFEAGWMDIDIAKSFIYREGKRYIQEMRQ